MRDDDARHDDDQGGDSVCWLHLVCESCGALIEREGNEHRPGCMVQPLSSEDGEEG